MKLPVWMVYSDIVNFLERTVKEEKKGAKEYYKEVVGDDITENAHPRYYEIGLVLDLGLNLTEWDEYPLRTQAEIKAQRTIKFMSDVVRRHYEKQDEKMKSPNKAASS